MVAVEMQQRLREKIATLFHLIWSRIFSLVLNTMPHSIRFDRHKYMTPRDDEILPLASLLANERVTWFNQTTEKPNLRIPSSHTLRGSPDPNACSSQRT